MGEEASFTPSIHRDNASPGGAFAKSLNDESASNVVPLSDHVGYGFLLTAGENMEGAVSLVTERALQVGGSFEADRVLLVVNVLCKSRRDCVEHLFFRPCHDLTHNCLLHTPEVEFSRHVLPYIRDIHRCTKILVMPSNQQQDISFQVKRTNSRVCDLSSASTGEI